MPRTRKKKKRKMVAVVSIFLLAILGVWFIFLPQDISKESSGKISGVPMKTDSSTALYFPVESGKGKDTEATQNIVTGEIKIEPILDYNDLEKDNTLKALTDARKKSLGIEKSLDMIVRSDESFIVGGVQVSLKEILEKAFTRQGKIYEGEISELGGTVPGKIKNYGIYVVQPGDNIWNIHFNILKEYYAFKGIQVATTADEPVSQGLSSGVGKLLKFSETMVIIYNLLDKKVVQDINLLQPLSKIVVYDMDQVFTLLKEINYDTINRIQFDGNSIWIPTTKS